MRIAHRLCLLFGGCILMALCIVIVAFGEVRGMERHFRVLAKRETELMSLMTEVVAIDQEVVDHFRVSRLQPGVNSHWSDYQKDSRRRQALTDSIAKLCVDQQDVDAMAQIRSLLSETERQEKWMREHAADDPAGVRDVLTGDYAANRRRLVTLYQQFLTRQRLSANAKESLLRRRHGRTRMLTFVLVALLAVSGLSYLYVLTREIVSPLHELTAAVEDISAGNLERQVGVRSADEFGTLALAFNQMTDAVRQRDAELREYAELLEDRVAERTAELQSANSRLQVLSNDLRAVAAVMSEQESRLDVSAVAQALTTTLVRGFGARAAALWMADESAAQLLPVAHIGPLAPVPGWGDSIPLNAIPAGFQSAGVARVGVSDGCDQPEDWGIADIKWFQDNNGDELLLVAMPLEAQEHISGFAAALFAPPLPEPRVDILDLFRKQASVALSDARTFEETCREAVSLETMALELSMQNKMLTEAATEHAHRRNNLDALVNSVEEGIIMVGTDGSLVMVNEALERMFEIRGRDFVHGPVDALIEELSKRTDDVHDFVEGVRQLLQTDHGEMERSFRQVRPEERTLECFASPVRDADEQTVGRIIAFRDITKESEIHALSLELEQRNLELAQAAKAMEVQRDRLESILNSTTDGILMMDLDGQVVVANERLREMFDLRSEPLVGQSASDLVDHIANHFADPAQLVDLLSTMDEDPELDASLTLDALLPSPRTYYIYVGPVRDDEGVLTGRIIAVRDVTRQAEMDRMKTELINVVSHELRTPLTSIKGYVDLILETPDSLSDEQAAFLSTVQRNVDRLSSMIDDMLDIARIESGRIEMHIQSTAYDEIVRHAVDTLLPQARAKQIELTVEIDDALPTMEVDPDRVAQVLLNLVGNAIKYTPEGGAVVVNVQSLGRFVRTSVRDNGIGIPPEEHEQVFSHFFRSSSPQAVAQTGTGLGLAITRAIVERLGGRVWFESAPGEGSTFFFTLPVHQGGGNENRERVSTT